MEDNNINNDMESVTNKSKSIYSDVDLERLELAKSIRTEIAMKKFEQIKQSDNISNRDMTALNEVLNGLSTDIHTHSANIVKLQENKSNENTAELIANTLLKINNLTSNSGIVKESDIDIPTNIVDAQEATFIEKELQEGSHNLELSDFVNEEKE